MSEEESPKLIIDEDWKTQAQSEKENLRQQQEQEPSSPADENSEMPIPPASFEFLITSLATQAVVALGQTPDPETNESVVHLELAKHHIDTLGILEDKTKGNRTAEEDSLLSTVTQQLRMLYVSVKSNPNPNPTDPSS